MTSYLLRVDAETNKRLELERNIRELENRIEELNEDLDAEKASRAKAEKQRKETSEVCVSISDLGYVFSQKNLSHKFSDIWYINVDAFNISM